VRNGGAEKGDDRLGKDRVVIEARPHLARAGEETDGEDGGDEERVSSEVIGEAPVRDGRPEWTSRHAQGFRQRR